MLKILLKAIVFGILIWMIACTNTTKNQTDSAFKADTAFSMQHSSLVHFGWVGSYRSVLFKNPWDTSEYAKKIVLMPRDANDGQIPKGYTAIYTPVRSIAVTSSTAISFLSKLGKLNLLNGVTDAAYIFNPWVKNAIKKGSIIEIGQGQVLNRERIIETDPDVVLASIYADQQLPDLTGTASYLIPFADYLEEKPLARAEWLKVMGALTQTETLADSIFNSIETNYIKLTTLARKAESKPTIFDGTQYEGVWYVSGGKSYMAALYEDAGADFSWKQTSERASIALGFEKVYEQARHAEFWRILVNSSDDYTMAKLAEDNLKYTYFDAFINKKVICCNSNQVPYYEDGVTQPDIILADLIFCLHPALLPNHQPVYYTFLR